MASFTYKGLRDDSDPIYKQGYSVSINRPSKAGSDAASESEANPSPSLSSSKVDRTPKVVQQTGGESERDPDSD